jgi:hypothetical protein
MVGYQVPKEYVEWIRQLNAHGKVRVARQFLLIATEACGTVRECFDPHDVVRETLAILTAGSCGEFHGIQQRIDKEQGDVGTGKEEG